MPWSHKVDTDELKMCVIISGVGSNRFSLSTSSSLTQQAFGVSHELEFKTPSDDVCALIQIFYVEKEYQEFRGRHIIQVPVVLYGKKKKTNSVPNHKTVALLIKPCLHYIM